MTNAYAPAFIEMPSKHETANGEMKNAVQKSWTANVSSGSWLCKNEN